MHKLSWSVSLSLSPVGRTSIPTLGPAARWAGPRFRWNATSVLSSAKGREKMNHYSSWLRETRKSSIHVFLPSRFDPKKKSRNNPGVSTINLIRWVSRSPRLIFLILSFPRWEYKRKQGRKDNEQESRPHLDMGSRKEEDDECQKNSLKAGKV